MTRSLFDPVPAADPCASRHGGNPFSEAAYANTDAAGDCRLILDMIRAAGSVGLTCDEVSAKLDRPPNSISGRFTQLAAAGLIVRAGPADKVERRPTRTGSMAAVWVATQRALAAMMDETVTGKTDAMRDRR